MSYMPEYEKAKEIHIEYYCVGSSFYLFFRTM